MIVCMYTMYIYTHYDIIIYIGQFGVAMFSEIN